MSRLEAAIAMQRVKVYRLNDEGTWDDKGTGHVSVEYMEQSNSLGLVVIGEGRDTRTLLIHRIGKDTAYQRQGGDTIITWSDPEVGTDIALSFQEPHGCAQIWHQIVEIQGGSSSSGLDNIGRGSPNGTGSRIITGGRIDEFEQVAGGRFDEFIPGSGPHTSQIPELPLPTFETLGSIVSAIQEVSIFQRDAMAAQLLKPGFLQGLVECFKRAEDLEDEESLHHLHNVFKMAILLNDTSLFETLFADDMVMDVVGALEYDPAVANVEDRIQHRQYLTEKATFKEVVPITEPALRAKITQTYRMGYIKEVVLPKSLDDATYAAFTSMILFNNVEVLMALHSDPTFFPELFKRLSEAEMGSQTWRDLVAFLQELTTIARHLQATQRNVILTRLIELGLFQVITDVLKSGDDDAKMRAADVLLADVLHDPTMLRRHLTEEEGSEMMSQLMTSLLQPTNTGLQEQVLEIFKLLLDPDTMTVSVDKDVFMDQFYEKHIDIFMNALVYAAENPTSPDAILASTINLIVELLCTCVALHSYRIKYYVLRNNVVEKVLKLLKRKEKWIVGAAVRFLRTCLGMRDEFYNRYLVRNQLLEPIIVAFIDNGQAYNLLNSAILELFDFLRKENMKALLAVTVASPHWAQLEAVDYIDTFKALGLKHEQNQEGMRGGSILPRSATNISEAAATRDAAAAEARRLKGEKEEDYDEESYFSREDGDTDTTTVAASKEVEKQPEEEAVQQQQEEPSATHMVLPLPKRKPADDDDDDDLSAFISKKPKRQVAATGVTIVTPSATPVTSNGRVVLSSDASPGLLPRLVADYNDDSDDDKNS